MGVVANVILVSESAVLGQVSGIRLASPYWSDTGELRQTLVDRCGCQFDLLRMYSNTGYDNGLRMNGTITYVAQAYGEPNSNWGLEPFAGELPNDPLRARYAAVNGPAAEVAWARARLNDEVISVEQTRTWNLSAVWRLGTVQGDVWLKSVPDFFGHEGQMIEMLAALDPSAVPCLIAHEPGRALMRAMPGVEQYEAPVDVLQRVINRLVPLQYGMAARVEDVLAAGAPDWREGPLTTAIADVFERHAHELAPADMACVAQLISELPQRFAEVRASGVPDTLVHGDCHPGNVRIDDETGALVIFDWGDSGVGCPLLDYPALASQSGADAVPIVQRMLCTAWRAAVPGCDPERALRAIEPIAALRQATIYRKFLDNIERAEHIYHADDPRMWLTRASRLFGSGTMSAGVA